MIVSLTGKVPLPARRKSEQFARSLLPFAPRAHRKLNTCQSLTTTRDGDNPAQQTEEKGDRPVRLVLCFIWIFKIIVPLCNVCLYSWSLMFPNLISSWSSATYTHARFFIFLIECARILGRACTCPDLPWVLSLPSVSVASISFAVLIRESFDWAAVLTGLYVNTPDLLTAIAISLNLQHWLHLLSVG